MQILLLNYVLPVVEQCDYLYVINGVERLILRRRSPEPEYGCYIKIGLDIYNTMCVDYVA